MAYGLKNRLPGYVATGLLTLATVLWTFWGFGEMYYEGWWGAWTNRLPYLAPMVICWIFALLALTWPRLGGWLIFLIGGVFTAWRWIRQAQMGQLTLGWAVGWFPISGVLVVAGVLFVMEGRYRQRRITSGWAPPSHWLRRNLGYVIVYAPSLATAVGVTLFFAPLLLTRFDDGDRGARRIEGNSVTLAWAPAGPGWSEGVGPSQEAGRLLPEANPSWNEIAFYGVPPVGFGDKPGYEERDATEADMRRTGLCRYLSEDGLSLMSEPQDIWRMPTVDEIVRSLVRGGENAGCVLRQAQGGVWEGQFRSADCDRQPNKDTPLWNPEASPIYYYAAEAYGEHSAWYVPYTGGSIYGGVIGHQPKGSGNSRHGYRCVREP